MKILLYLTFLILFILANSCSEIVKKIENQNYSTKIDNVTGSSTFNILFGHNIHGETHPCGCRQFPLGGLAQIAGIISEQRMKAPLIYVDTGDTFFPSSKLPESMHSSLKFIAEELHSSLESLGLDYYLPGDQDFAFGESYIEELSKRAKYQFIISNLSPTSKIKHKPWVQIKISNEKSIFLFGIISPEVMPNHLRGLFTDEKLAIEKTLDQIDDLKKSNDVIILMSHSGIERDAEYAKFFPQIEWIIGAHSQSFLNTFQLENKTKLVQVLSRNHYLGQIEISLNTDESNYKVIEVRDDWKDKIANNPYLTRLDKHKIELKKIQLKEQDAMNTNHGVQKIPTANSCLECHSSQVAFWQKTAHSLAYQTLRDANEESNPNCTGCHSVGFQNENGFSRTSDIVLKDSKPISKNDSVKYWKNISSFFKPGSSIRSMSNTDREKISHQWQKADKKLKISHNFANVQCLNCHDKSAQHPFETQEVVKTNIQSKCLSCHNADQSPHWYNKNNKGLADTLNKQVYQEKLKLVACPK